MGRALRSMLVLVLALAVVWGACTFRVGHRTVAGHLSRMVLQSSAVRTAIAWTRHKLRRSVPHEDAPKQKEQKRPAEATAHRVALLESAARTAEVLPPEGAAKTRIDERLSQDQKKALDALISSRNARSP
jgi:hypothetical protein